MSSIVELTVPDLGNFDSVPVVDVLVKKGDVIEVDTPLITLETDKASMDVPSTHAGTIVEMLLERGDKISKGTVIARIDTAPAGAARAEEEQTVIQKMPDVAADLRAPARPEAAGDTVRMPLPPGGPLAAHAAVAAAARPESPKAETPPAEPAKAEPPKAEAPKPEAPKPEAPKPEAPEPKPAQAEPAKATTDTTGERQVAQPGERLARLVVLGAGPGGYTAAFRAADLGMQVTLIERWPNLGGVCLNVGCIPSKALLHAAKVIEEAEEMGAHGIAFGAPAIDLDRLRSWKTSVVRKLTGGLRMLAKQRTVDVVQGTGRFVDPHVIEVQGPEGTQRVRFEQCIIAAGSEAIRLPGLPNDPRVMDSTDALELPEFSGRMLIIGGGIIGLEMACVYDALGTKVSVVELTPQLMPGCDVDLVRPLEKRLRARYEQILLGTKFSAVEPTKDGLRVTFSGDKAPAPQVFERVLVAVGRSPNGKVVGADAAGVKVSDRGFIPVDKQMRTNVPHIFAIGDVAGPPMLAHKASHEAKVAAEVAAGHKAAFDSRVIPSVAYTDPEVAWVGLTETEAQAKNIPFKKAAFPWVASGRSLSLGRDEGFTKLLFDPQNNRVIGGGIVGTNAGELISEVALAIEMGADASDVGLTIHPHPTLSETVAFAAEAFDGTLTDLYMPKR